MSLLRSNGIEREIFFTRTRFLTNSINTLGTNSAYFPLRLALPFDLSNQTRKVGTFFVMSRLNNSELKLRNGMFIQGMLWCARCKQFHPVKEFRISRSPKVRNNYGYRFYCLSCEKSQNADRKDLRSQFANTRNTGLKKYWVELAGEKCQRCGFYEFVSALEFHHVYPALKKGEPSKLIFNNNKEKAWREIDKCCLLCSICHRAYKAREWQAEFIKRPGLGYTIGADLPLDDKRYETDKPPKLQQAPLPLFAQRPAGAQQLGLF